MGGFQMKLLFCLECQDIVRLSPERRTCACGRSWGQYLEDHRTTVQTRNSLSLAMNGPDFDRAIHSLMENSKEFTPYLFVRAWFNPTSEEDVRYVEPDERVEVNADKTAMASAQSTAPERTKA
jgi:hypothetical protein